MFTARNLHLAVPRKLSPLHFLVGGLVFCAEWKKCYNKSVSSTSSLIVGRRLHAGSFYVGSHRLRSARHGAPLRASTEKSRIGSILTINAFFALVNLSTLSPSCGSGNSA